MSRKILSQAGTSLADVYEIEGSIAGLEQLDVEDIKGVHDLGPQIHSERLLSFLVLGATANHLQDVTFEVITAGIPDSTNRLLGLSVISNKAARLDHASVVIQDPDTGRELPIWIWDTADDRERQITWSLDGAAVAVFFELSSLATPNIPQLLTRIGPSGAMPQLILRGLTAGFGAGNVTTRVIYHLARPNTGNPPAGEASSHGLPIPSW